jgi:hypothetical protein
LAIVPVGLLLLLVPTTRPAAEERAKVATSTTASTTSTTSTTIELVAEPATTTTTSTAPASPVAASPATLMLIGDSMAFTAALGLAPHDIEERCVAWPGAWKDALARDQPAMVAIVVGRWELMDRVYDGRWTNLFDAAFAAYVEGELGGAVQLVQSGGARVVLFTTPYYRRGVRPDGSLFPEDDPARVDVMTAIIRRVGERLGASVVDLGGRLSPEGRYTRDVDGVRVRSDGVHLTAEAGNVLAPWLFPQLQLLLAAPPPVPVPVVPEHWSAPVE